MSSIKGKLKLKVIIPKNEVTENPNSHTIDCSEIFENIHLSSYKCSLDYKFLKDNKFTHIINCAGGSQSFETKKFSDFSYHTIELKDEITSDLTESILKFTKILSNLSENPENKVLIHCKEGVSRAPALLCSYLMLKKNIGLDEALELLQEKRKCVDINLGFMVQLRNLEKKPLTTFF